MASQGTGRGENCPAEQSTGKATVRTEDKTMAIFFNTRGDKYSEFRNTSEHSFTLDGEQWQSAEHYVQAQRFKCEEAKAEVRKAPYAFVAKAIARARPEALRSDWHTVRDSVMEKAVRSKFASHPELGERLAQTGADEIIEASALSHYWGAGADGRGLNKLGKIMMKVRTELQESLAAAGALAQNRLG